MKRSGLLSLLCSAILACSLSACVVQSGAEGDQAQTAESDVSSTEPGQADSEPSERLAAPPFVLDSTLRKLDSFVPNEGQTEGPNPLPWSESNRGGAQPSGSSSK